MLSCIFQVSIGAWLHTAEVCFEEESSKRLSDLFHQREKEQGWAVWSVIPPFRGVQLIPAYVATLKHYLIYHTRVRRTVLKLNILI